MVPHRPHPRVVVHPRPPLRVTPHRTPPPKPPPPLPTPVLVAHVQAVTAVPHVLAQPMVTAAPAAPEAAFVYVAITIPALVAAGAGALNHVLGRGR
ncbi:hypothetical protein [Streptacidiphilus fuscans]|uniref:Uncharacterized protein n=1 Tax=Streptacidiphilus fuscans TaxID=2789292 RepID=A0A931FFT5_9ACTN|nr:hypothetical protein [Streptacidiphilus fuscans]MBF9070206.1 hypothetical protein [Streptacidiphilus fuscans]